MKVKMTYSVGLLVLLALMGAECQFLNFDTEVEAALSPDARSVAANIETTDPKCLELTELLSTVLAYFKQYHTMEYPMIVYSVKGKIGLDVEDPAQLKEFACKLINIKSLKGLLELDISENIDDLKYSEVKGRYQRIQKMVAKMGGYTNAPRILQFLNDMVRRAENLTPNATTPAEATTLPELTKFFEVMQVKYGSRWISFFALNQEVLITDPRATAKQLFESQSAEEVEKVLGEEASAYNIRTFVLLGNRDIIPGSLGLAEIYAHGLVVLGELGLLNLEV